MKRFLALAVLAACGDDGGVRVLPDGPPGTATVTVRIDRVPRANHLVYFQGPDGAEIAAVRTDADGKASAVVPEGSSITTPNLYTTYDGAKSLATVMGVKPGDDIVLDGDEGLQGTTEINFPTYAGATGYSVTTNCGGDEVSATPASLSLDQCSPTVDTLVIARTPAGPTMFLAKLDQPLAGPIDLRGETWREASVVRTTYTSMPEHTGYAYSRHHLVTPRGVLTACQTGGELTGTIAEASCPEIPGTTGLDLFYVSSRDDEWYSQWLVLHAVTSRSPTIDLADTMIVAPTTSASFEGATRTFTWSETPTGATPHYMALTAYADGLRWDILAPYSAGTLALPTLVGDAATYNATTDFTTIVHLYTATGGYDAVRRFGPQTVHATITNEVARIIMSSAYDG